jgi:type I restriction enzyme S subunit
VSRIDDLIAEQCSDGVPFKTLGEIGELVRGNGMPKSDFAQAGVGAIHYGQIYTHYGTWAVETISFVSPATASHLAKVDPGDVIITNTSENLDDVGKAVAWLGERQIVTGGHATVLKHNQVPKYIAYWLQSPSFQRQKKRLATGTKVIDVSAAQLASVKIPLPPLDVQREIVRILDRFTQLERELGAEVEAELLARKQQFEYHRDMLLNFDGRKDVPRMTLAEVAHEFGRGKSRHRPRNDPKLYGGDVPFIQTGDVRNAGHVIHEYTQTYNQDGLAQSKLWPAGTLCITIAANIAETTILGFDACFPDSVIGFVADPTKADVRYVEYLLIYSKSSLQARGRGSAQSNISLATFENEPLPFPSIEEQVRISSVLEKLDTLATDLSSGLSAEIEARRQRYAHYRDRLLSFEERVA